MKKTNVSSVLEAKNSSSPAPGWNAGASEARDGKARLWTLLIILAVGAFYISTLRQGHQWGDDFGMYIRHGQNIAEGRPYADTGFIHNPRKMIGPLTYPPVYPLLVAPVYKVWGMNLTAMKVEVILIFLLSLFVIYLAFRDDLPWPYPVALVALVGFNPQFWMFKDNLLSDIPFILFTYLSLYLIHKAYRMNRVVGWQIIYVLSISVSIYLAYGTRSIGLVLIPCLFVYDIIKNKRPSLFGLSAILLAVAFIYLQNKYLHSDSAYAGQFGLSRTKVALNQSRTLILGLSGFWADRFRLSIQLTILAILTGLAIAGYLTRVGKRQITCFELFMPFYVGSLVLLSIKLEARYLMPIIPLYLYYVFLGIRTVSGWIASRKQEAEKLLFAGMLIALLASYGRQYTRLDYGLIQNGIAKSETQQLFDYVQRETGENEVIIFIRPRALSLFTGRTSAVWHIPAEDGELWDFFRQVNASYLIVGPEDEDMAYQKFIRGFVDRNRERLRENFANPDFHVYRIK